MSVYITAIEIGSSKIVGAVGKINEDNTLSVIAVEEQSIAQGSVRHGCVINVEEVSSKLNIVKKLLENSAKLLPGKITGAYIALGGKSMASHPAEASRSFTQETEITETIIAELREQVRHDKSSNKEVLSSVPLNYTIDGKKVTMPVGTLGYQIRARYNLIVSDEKNRKNIKTAFDKINLKIVGGFARILAIDSLILTKDQRGLGSVIIDFGAETTTVAVYKDNALRFMSTIPMGSRLLTHDLATILNITEERAEELKLNHVNLNASKNEDDRVSPDRTLDNIDYKLINNIVRARLSEIIANINYQIGQSHLKPEELTEGIVLIGKGSRLNGLRELLHQQTNLKIAYPSSIEDISIAGNISVPVNEALDVIAILAAAVNSRKIVSCVEYPAASTNTTASSVTPDTAKTDEKAKAENADSDSEGGRWGKRWRNFADNIFKSANFDEDE